MAIIKSKQLGSRARAKADTSTLFGWKHAHSGHGAGPQLETRIHIYDKWMCPCGERFTDPPRMP